MSFLDPIGRLCHALLRLDSPGTPGPSGGLELQEAHLEQLTVMLQWFDDAERCDPVRLGAAKSLSELSHLTYDGFTDEDGRVARCEISSRRIYRIQPPIRA